MEIPEIELNKIDMTYNVRKDVIDKEKIHELAKNIEENGLLQPIVVMAKGNRYELIIGQRRYLAFKELGWSKIPAIIESIKNETDAILKSFSENMLREELSIKDKNRVAQHFMLKFKDIKVVAHKLGVTMKTVKNYLGFSGLPKEIQEFVVQKKLNLNTALRISKSQDDEEKAIEVAKLVIQQLGNENKQNIIETAKDHPHASITEIIELSKKRRRKIIINPADTVYEALIKASESYDSSKEEITLEALEDWLKTRGFING